VEWTYEKQAGGRQSDLKKYMNRKME